MNGSSFVETRRQEHENCRYENGVDENKLKFVSMRLKGRKGEGQFELQKNIFEKAFVCLISARQANNLTFAYANLLLELSYGIFHFDIFLDWCRSSRYWFIIHCLCMCGAYAIVYVWNGQPQKHLFGIYGESLGILVFRCFKLLQNPVFSN